MSDRFIDPRHITADQKLHVIVFYVADHSDVSSLIVDKTFEIASIVHQEQEVDIFLSEDHVLSHKPDTGWRLSIDSEKTNTIPFEAQVSLSS